MPLRAILPDGNKSATRTAKSKQETRAATNSKANSDESQFILATSQTLSHGKTRQARRARPHELTTLPKYHEVVTKWKTAVRYLSRPEIKMIPPRTFDFDEKTSFADRVSLICLKSEFPIEPWILGDMQCLVGTSTVRVHDLAFAHSFCEPDMKCLTCHGRFIHAWFACITGILSFQKTLAHIARNGSS